VKKAPGAGPGPLKIDTIGLLGLRQGNTPLGVEHPTSIGMVVWQP